VGDDGSGGWDGVEPVRRDVVVGVVGYGAGRGSKTRVTKRWERMGDVMVVRGWTDGQGR